MWHPPFTTSMERGENLIDLRENNSFSSDFEERAPVKVKTIIGWLCNTNPSSRPTASELLSSNLLPPKIENEQNYLDEVLRTLSNPEAKCFSQLMSALFLQDPFDHLDYTFDSINEKHRSNMDYRVKTHLRTRMQQLFEQHGAMEHDTPLLVPMNALNREVATSSSNTNRTAYKVLNTEGVTLKLPYTLTEPLARMCARNGVYQLKRYYFGHVFRNTGGSGGHPRQLMEADFDIIWDEPTSFRLMEMEVLHVVTSVLNFFTSILPTGSSFYIRLCNACLLKGILEICDVQPARHAVVLHLLSVEKCSGNAQHWYYVKKQLKEAALLDITIEALQPFFYVPDTPVAALEYIKRAVTQRSTASMEGLGLTHVDERQSKRTQKRINQIKRATKDAMEGVLQLQQLMQCAESLHMEFPVEVDLGLRPRGDYYNCGLVFQAVLVPESKNKQEGEIIAEGGRYDTLVSRYRLPSSRLQSPSIAAIGARFALDKMVAILRSQEEMSHNSLLDMQKSIVLVCTPGPGGSDMLQQRMLTHYFFLLIVVNRSS